MPKTKVVAASSSRHVAVRSPSHFLFQFYPLPQTQLAEPEPPPPPPLLQRTTRRRGRQRLLSSAAPSAAAPPSSTCAAAARTPARSAASGRQSESAIESTAARPSRLIPGHIPALFLNLPPPTSRTSLGRELLRLPPRTARRKPSSGRTRPSQNPKV